VTEPVAGLKPYTPLQLTGRDIYVREGCYNCHSQMIRPFRAEVERYGPYSVAGEFVYDRPFQWGSKRTGPDLHRVGGRYSDDWHRIHLLESARRGARVEHARLPVAGEDAGQRRRHRGEAEGVEGARVPYGDEDLKKAKADLQDKTEMDALIAYLQNLGTTLKRGGAK
jgi:cytochrome c oxidase cbb3-type subunit 2